MVLLLANSARADEWYETWMNTMDTIGGKPKEEQISTLGRVVKVGDKPNLTDEENTVFRRSQAMLLAIPGHAQYYRDRINAAREKMEMALKSGNDADYATFRHTLSDEVMYGFRTLQQLPSVETVRVLGEFLFDERGYVKVPSDNTTEKQRYESIKHGPVFHKAAGGLDTLPIVAKPMKRPPQGYDSPEETTPWRQWYQEIKDGKRTFRFEGDPTEYDLDGPAPKEKLERIAMHQRREGGRASRHAPAVAQAGASEQNPAASPTQRNVAYAMIAAGIAVMASMVWYFKKRRQRFGS